MAWATQKCRSGGEQLAALSDSSNPGIEPKTSRANSGIFNHKLDGLKTTHNRCTNAGSLLLKRNLKPINTRQKKSSTSGCQQHDLAVRPAGDRSYKVTGSIGGWSQLHLTLYNGWLLTRQAHFAVSLHYC